MSVAANRYAKALIDALPPSKAEAAYEQLRTLNSALDEQPEARRLLENPTVSADRRKGFLAAIASASGFDKEVQNFVGILIERNRLDVLDEILGAYQKFLDQRLGIVRASVATAQPLDAVQNSELAAKLQSATGKQVRMDVSVDASLIGGFVATVGSTIYDGSLRQQLKSFKARLVQK